MSDPSKATSHFIAGVNLPVIEAEPDTVVAFDQLRADAVKGIAQEVDQTEEIEDLLSEGKALLARLEQ